MAPKKAASKKKENLDEFKPTLFLSLNALLVGDEVKLELDFCPPFKMVEPHAPGAGSRGFKSQKAPSFYDVAELDRLFKYITKVLPCAIIENMAEGTYCGQHHNFKIKAPKKLEKLTTNPDDRLLKKYMKSIKNYNLRNQGLPEKLSKPLDAGYAGDPLETDEGKQVLSAFMKKFRISRVHVDPDKNNSLSSQSTGGDVPPPPYPPR